MVNLSREYYGQRSNHIGSKEGDDNMYCSQCGKELKEDTRFCPFCGCPVNMEPKDEEISKETLDIQKEKSIDMSNGDQTKEHLQSMDAFAYISADHSFFEGTAESAVHEEQFTVKESSLRTKSVTNKERKIKPVVWIVSIILLIVTAGGCFFGIREYHYKKIVESAEKAVSNHQYEDSIVFLKDAIQMRPRVVSNYMLLASAYLEEQQLFAAKQTLENGYATTESKSLQNVSIWGPTSAIETGIFFTSDWLPLTRQEYYFDNQDTVKGYISAYGNIIFVLSYHFDTFGNIDHVSVSDVNDYFGFGVNRTLMETGWPFLGDPYMSWDYTYNSNGSINITSNMSEKAITFFWEADTCAVLTDGEEQISIQYDDNGKPTQILSSNGAIYSFLYQEDESYVVESFEDDYQLGFDSNGQFVSLIGDDADNFSTQFDNQNRVESVSMIDRHIDYTYSDNGYLESVTDHCYIDDMEFSYLFSYDEAGHLTQIYQTTDSGEAFTYQMHYDQNGNLLQTTTLDQDCNIISQREYKYSENGMLNYYTFISNSDDIIKIYTPVYDDYGEIESYTAESAIYSPGTYIGTADGFGGEVIVEVTVDYTQITNVDVKEQSETAGIGTGAIDTLINEMIEIGSPNVDVISGATISSQAFIEAVKHALADARIYIPEKVELSGEEVKALIVQYYNNQSLTDGNYVITEQPDEFLETDTAYQAIVRYQLSDEEAEKIFQAGGMPEANTLYSTVTVSKMNWLAQDDLGNTWNLLSSLT